MSSYSRIALESWLKTIEIERDSRVLDIGGSQLPIKGRIKSDITGEYKILDLENPHETRQKPDIIKDLNEITIKSEYLSHFDTVFCIEMSEYWWNPSTAIENIKSFMTVGGKLYISFHMVYPAHNPIEYDYLRYTENGVKMLLNRAELRIDTMRYRSGEAADIRTFYAAERMKSAKGYPNHSALGFLVKATRIK